MADENPEDNQAQAGSDAPTDEVTPGTETDFSERSDRAHGKGSDANGVPAFDDAAGEERNRLYKETGSPIVSRMD